MTLAIDPDKVQAGWIALAFVVGLGVAVLLLYRSMNKQLRRVDFEERQGDAPTDEREGDAREGDAPTDEREGDAPTDEDDGAAPRQARN